MSGADASLIERIDRLIEHRVISEVDKDKYWNPRWWTSGEEVDAKTSVADKDAPNGDEALTLLPLSEKDPRLEASVNRLEV